jgi:ankyrin repeat protein
MPGKAEEKLLRAVRNSDVDAVRAAVEEGADIDHQYPQEGSRTALHLAVVSGNMSLVQWIVLLGADLDACDGQGQSAVALAKAAGNTWISEFLEEHGAGGMDAGGSDEDVEDNGYSGDDDEDEVEDDQDEHDEEEDPLAKALAFTWGRMVMRVDMNEDSSDLVAEARSLIKQGADTTFLKRQAQLLRELKIIP